MRSGAQFFQKKNGHWTFNLYRTKELSQIKYPNSVAFRKSDEAWFLRYNELEGLVHWKNGELKPIPFRSSNFRTLLKTKDGSLWLYNSVAPAVYIKP